MRKFKFAALAVGISLMLTACDPPMPESLLVEIAEQNIQCENGTVDVSVPHAAAELTSTWLDAMTISCEAMSFQTVADGEEAAIVMSADAPKNCTPFASTPFSIDAAVFATNVAEGATINLNAQIIEGILGGSISNWNDAQITEANPDFELPATPVKLVKESPAAAITAMSSWLETLGAELPKGSLTASDKDPQEILSNLDDGSIALVAYSESLLFGATLANVLIGSDTYADAVVPGLDTITSASTQWVITKTDSTVAVELDPKLAPVAPEGSDEAPLPYQAIFPITMNLCGQDSTLVRTIGRYFLRQDQQGVLATSTMIPLTEKLRIAGATLVAKGLPTPTPAELPAE